MPGEWGGEKKLNLPVIIVIVVVIAAVAGAVVLWPKGGGTGGLTASFTYSPAHPSVGETVYFTDASTGGDIASWSWDFGDGGSSTDQNPSHQFAVGTHDVTLTITTGDNKTDDYTVSITVTGEGPTTTISVFNDSGLLPEAGLMVDAFVWPQVGDQTWVTQEPFTDGVYTGIGIPPEGVSCWYTRNGPESQAYGGWGVFVGVNPEAAHQIDPDAPHIIDLSGVDNLEFYVNSPINLHVELQDWNTTTDNKGVKSQYVWIGNYGWENTGGWEKITIPKSVFNNVNLSKIWCPFMISTAANNPLVEWYVDWVQWVAG